MNVNTEQEFLQQIEEKREEEEKEEEKAQKKEMFGNTEESGDVDKCFETLNNSIQNLNIHVNDILKDHEQKYLLAFNTYMYDVHKEIRILKKILSEEKVKALGDIKVKKLQKELNWYINECLRLDKDCQSLKLEAEKWKRNSSLIKDHMLFLEKRLLKALEKIIVYERKYGKEEEKKEEIINEKKEEVKKNSSGKKPIGENQISNDTTKYEELNKKIKELEKKVKEQKRTNATLQEQITKYYMHQSKYEKLFIDCAQEIKKEIERKKVNMEKEKYIEDHFTPLVDNDVLDIPDLRKEDKKNLIKMFFSSTEMIHFISKHIFANENVHNIKKGDSNLSRINISKKTNVTSFVL